MRSPLTAIFFAFELTRSADSLLPLMVASFGSYATTVLLMKRSILTEKIARRGHDIFREYYVDPLESHSVQEAMTKNPRTVNANMPVARLAREIFGTGKHNGYPIVDDGGNVLGLVSSSDLEKIPALDKIQDLTAKDLIQRQPVFAYPYESSKTAADRMAEQSVGRVMVLDPITKKLLGIVTRSDLLKARSRHLQEESKREKVFSFGAKREAP